MEYIPLEFHIDHTYLIPYMDRFKKRLASSRIWYIDEVMEMIFEFISKEFPYTAHFTFDLVSIVGFCKALDDGIHIPFSLKRDGLHDSVLCDIYTKASKYFELDFDMKYRHYSKGCQYRLEDGRIIYLLSVKPKQITPLSDYHVLRTAVSLIGLFGYILAFYLFVKWNIMNSLMDYFRP